MHKKDYKIGIIWLQQQHVCILFIWIPFILYDHDTPLVGGAHPLYFNPYKWYVYCPSQENFTLYTIIKEFFIFISKTQLNKKRKTVKSKRKLVGFYYVIQFFTSGVLTCCIIKMCEAAAHYHPSFWHFYELVRTKLAAVALPDVGAVAGGAPCWGCYASTLPHASSSEVCSISSCYCCCYFYGVFLWRHYKSENRTR